MTRTYLFRVTSEGVDRLQQELEATGLAGKRAFEILSAASTSMGRALSPAEAQAEALRSKLQALQQQLADRKANEAAADYQRLAGAARQLAERYDPLSAAQRRFAENTELANRALANGALSIAQHVKVLNGETLALAQAETAIKRQQAAMNAGGRSFRSFGGIVQQAGYQIGDFAVQVASGQGVLRPFIQQGTQLVSMFGPWGAAIGAAGAVVGALATAFLGLEDSTKQADEAQKAFNKTLDTASDLMEKLNGKAETSRQNLLAQRQALVTYKQAELATAQSALDRTPEFRPSGRTLVPNEAHAEQLDRVKELKRELLDLQATLGFLGGGHGNRVGLDFDVQAMIDRNPSLFGGVSGATADKVSELDKLKAALQADAEMAGLSGKAHAERQAILRAEQAAQKDYQNHLRDDPKLSADERAAVLASADAAYSKAEALRTSAEAQKKSEELDRARAKAAEDANKALDDQIIGIEEETYQLGLSDKERFIRQKLLEAENIAIRGGIPLTDERIQQLKIETAALFDTSAAIKDKKKAEDEAAREAERQSKEREKIAEREAELELQPYKNAISGLQSAWTDGWEKVLGGNIQSFSDFFATVKQLGIRWAAEMASLMTFRPVAGSILGAIAPGLAASLGFGSSAAAAAQNSGIGGISSGGFGSFAVSSAPLAALFGGAGGATSGIGSWLFGGGTPVYSNGIQVGTSGGGLLGAMPGLAGFLNSGLGTGLVGAALSAGISLASGGSPLQAGISGGGALIGGLAGSVFGQPILGAALGGIAGSIISSLFGGKEKKPPKQQSITDISALASGYFGAGGTVTKHSGDVTSALGKNAANALNTFLASIGGTVSGQLGGQNQLLYYGRTPRFMSIVGGVNNQYGDDAQGAQDAVADFIARTMVAAAQSDKLQGVSEAVKTAIANSGAKDAAALDAAVAFGKFVDGTDRIREPADAAAKAMADLAAQMAKAKQQAEDYGLDAAQLPEIFRRNFIDGINDEILQLKDPTAYALKQVELDRAAAIAQATSLGADLNAVEELYGLKRQAIVEQGLRGVSGTFQDFFNALLTDGNLSTLSPQEQYKVTKAAFEGASNDNLIAAATPFLQASRNMFASSKSYADDFRAVLERVKAAGGLTADIPFFASGGMHGGGWMMTGEQGPELVATGAARVFDAQTTAAIMAAANADLSPKLLGQIVRSFGQGPDTELVHLRPDELADARARWGGGVNPVTSLPAFGSGGGGSTKSGNAGNAGGAGGGKGSAGGTKGNEAGHNVGSTAGPTGSMGTQGGSKTKSGSANAGGGGGTAGGTKSDFDKAYDQTVDAYSKSTNLAGPNPGDIAGGGIVGSNGYLGLGGVAGNQGSSTLGQDAVDRGWASYGSQAWKDQQEKVKAAIAAGVSPADITKAAEAYAGRLNDYTDRYNTFGEDVGNWIASFFGFNEIAPTLDFNNLNWNADWGFDPAGLIGGLIGMGVGLPFGGGLIADFLSRLVGRPLEMNLGPNALADDPDVANGVSNALRVQGASDISIGGNSISANTVSTPAGGVLGGGDIPRSLSSLVTGGQNSVSGSLQTGFDRTAKGNEALIQQVQQLIAINETMVKQLQALRSSQDTTNDVLRVQARGSTNQLLSRN